MSEQKTSLIDQFSQAIQSVKDRITGYNSKVSEFKQGVNANADKLRDLVERLRQCLQGLSSLKNNHDEWIIDIRKVQRNDRKNIKIIVVGLGYVGLPLAIEFSKKYPNYWI